MTYGLQVRRYNTWQTFDDMSELRSELGRHFAHSERPIVNKLTDFSNEKFDNNMARHDWRDISVFAYAKEEA